MALGQPADGTIVTIDPDRERTDLARGWWRQAGIADERITVVPRRRSRRSRPDEPALAGPFDLAFIDALKPEYEALSGGAHEPAGAGRARRSPTTSCGAGGSRAPGRSRPTTRTPPRCARSMPPSSPTRASARRSCRSATACSSPRGSADGAATVAMRVRVRLFAIQRELAGRARCRSSCADGADVEDAWAALVDALPGPGAGPLVGPVRAERRLRRRRRRRSPMATRSP